jgi:hypothetical protein
MMKTKVGPRHRPLIPIVFITYGAAYLQGANFGFLVADYSNRGLQSLNL